MKLYQYYQQFSFQTECHLEKIKYLQNYSYFLCVKNDFLRIIIIFFVISVKAEESIIVLQKRSQTNVKAMREYSFAFQYF